MWISRTSYIARRTSQIAPRRLTFMCIYLLFTIHFRIEALAATVADRDDTSVHYWSQPTRVRYWEFGYAISEPLDKLYGLWYWSIRRQEIFDNGAEATGKDKDNHSFIATFLLLNYHPTLPPAISCSYEVRIPGQGLPASSTTRPCSLQLTSLPMSREHCHAKKRRI